MLKINFSNVEEILFANQEVREILPAYFSNYFETWAMAKRLPVLRQIGKQAIYDLLNSLGDNEIASLEEFFGEKINVERLNYSVVRNLTIPIHEVDGCEHLCNIVGNNYYSMWRDNEHLYITFWR
jgi:hypothetical protein